MKPMVMACVLVLGAGQLRGQTIQPPAPRPPAATQPATRPAGATHSAEEILAMRLGDVRLEEVPLRGVLEWLAQASDANVYISWKRLAPLGIRPDDPVTVRGRGLTVRSFLELLMHEAGRDGARLSYRVSENLIHVASAEELGENLVTRIYRVGDLVQSRRGRPAEIFIGRMRDAVTAVGGVVGPGVAVPLPITQRYVSGMYIGVDEPGQSEASIADENQRLMAELVAAIIGAVEPDTWEVNGGRGTIRVIGDVLVVRNSPRVHEVLGGPFSATGP